MKATGGKLCGKRSSRESKVRKNNGSLFVGAFCQSNVGDVTPNVLGAFCTDSGRPCDFNHSSCHGNDLLCLGRGPGYPDEILSTKIIGERQFQKAAHLFTTATQQLTGTIDYRHVYLNFTDIEVELLDGNKKVKTCPAALGPGFAAGTTDGPGAFGFQQGDTKVSSSSNSTFGLNHFTFWSCLVLLHLNQSSVFQINELWRKLRDALKKPTPYQVDCQKPKTVLLDTGEMFVPYAWAVRQDFCLLLALLGENQLGFLFRHNIHLFRITTTYLETRD